MLLISLQRESEKVIDLIAYMRGKVCEIMRLRMMGKYLNGLITLNTAVYTSRYYQSIELNLIKISGKSLTSD